MKRVLLVAGEAAEIGEHTTPAASTEPDRKVGASFAVTEELERVRALGVPKKEGSDS